MKSGAPKLHVHEVPRKAKKPEVSVTDVVASLTKDIERDERTLQDYKKLLDKYGIPHDVPREQVDEVIESTEGVSKGDAKRIREILGGGNSPFNYITVTDSGLRKKRATLQNVELTGEVPPEFQPQSSAQPKPQEVEDAEFEEINPDAQPVRSKKPLAKRQLSELDPELLNLDTDTRTRLTRFIQNNTTKLMSLAAYLQEMQGGGDGTSPYHAEAMEKTVEDVYEKLEKEARKDKVLKAEFFSNEEGRAQLRAQLRLFAQEYSIYFNQIKESNLEIPQTLEGKKAAFVRMLQQFKFEPDVVPAEHPDEFVAQGMLNLQLKTARPGETPTHPRGSGVMAGVEAKGVRIVSEVGLSYMETSVMAAGLALATAVFGPQLVATLGVKVLSWVVAVILSYGFVLPFKNSVSREIVASGGSLKKGIGRAMKKHPLGAISLATVLAAAAGPAANSVINAMNVSSTNAERISVKFDEATHNLERVLAGSETGEMNVVDSAQETANIDQLFAYSDTIFNTFIDRELHGQIFAGLRAEEHPEEIDSLRIQYPGMTFGETGRGGAGPKYHAKEALFLTGVFASDVTPADRAIVTRARAEAGLQDGESLEDAERRFYREYNEIISTPVRHDDGVTESPRERVVRVVHEIQRLQRILEEQNPASSAYNLLIVGEPPVSPELLEYYETQLRAELVVVNGHFSDFRTRAVHAIDIMKTASNEIVVGSTLSLTVPEPALIDAIQPILGIELVSENPWEGEAREWFAEHFGGTPEQYTAQSSMAVGSIGYLLALLLTLAPTAAFLESFRRRGKRTREEQKYHQKSVENSEEEAVDFWYDYINTTLVPLMPGTPTYPRMRVRMALREFIANNVHDLADSREMGDSIKEWLITEFRPGQITDDTRMLRGFEGVLNNMRAKPEYVAKFYEILFPGYTKLRKALDYRKDLFAKIGRGQELTATETAQLAEQRTHEGHKAFLQGLSLEMAHASLEREIVDTRKKAEILSQILLDVKVGADTYHVFSDDAEAQSKIRNDGVVGVINARQYTWTVEGSQGQSTEPQLVAPNQVDSRHMEIVRRVAETTEGAKVIQSMMAETQRHLDSLQQRYEITQLEIVRNGLQAKSAKGSFSIPESILVNDEQASLRDQLTKGAGLFQDVAYEIREAFETVPQEGKATTGNKEYAVRTQLDAMARTFFSSDGFKEFINSINAGRTGNDRLRADLRLVYGEKAQRVEGEVEEIDVPGFSLRLRLTNQNGEELRVNRNGEVVPATSETRSDDQDFQMSHVLLYNKTPQLSARAFVGWAERTALPALYSKATKQWLRQNFIDGDYNKETETKFKLPPTRAEAEEWIKAFYRGNSMREANTLRYKRADRARELANSGGRITPDDLEVFFSSDTTYGGVPLPEQIEKVLDIYYPKATQGGFIGGIRSAAVRAQGLTLDLNGEGYATIRGKKPMLISDYVVRKGKFPRR